MGDPLRASFLQDLRCDARDADRLAALARAHFARRPEGAEDSEEDLVLRLGDPRVLGEFATTAVGDIRLRRATRVALAERVFDLLPLPDSEDDVILVEARAPPHLLALVDFLGARGELTVLHILHLVYSVYLDRSLVTRVPRIARSSVLDRVISFAGQVPGPCALYVAMHLAAAPPAEARAAFLGLLRRRGVRPAFKRPIAELAAAGDGGVGGWVRIAKEEGLLPRDADPDAPEVLAGAPRLPEALAPAARGWLSDREAR